MGYLDPPEDEYDESDDEPTLAEQIAWLSDTLRHLMPTVTKRQRPIVKRLLDGLATYSAEMQVVLDMVEYGTLNCWAGYAGGTPTCANSSSMT